MTLAEGRRLQPEAFLFATAVFFGIWSVCLVGLIPGGRPDAAW